MSIKKSATIGEYVIQQQEDGKIVAFKYYDNVKGALREISEEIGFEYDPQWTTRQFGSKIIDAINEK